MRNGDPAAKTGVAGTDAGPRFSKCRFGDALGDWRRTLGWAVEDAIPDSLNLEGDRERDLRSDLTVELTSTWWTWVGEGSVSVPPLPFEKDMAAPFSRRNQQQVPCRDSVPIHDPQEVRQSSKMRGIPADRTCWSRGGTGSCDAMGDTRAAWYAIGGGGSSKMDAISEETNEASRRSKLPRQKRLCARRKGTQSVGVCVGA